MADAIASETDLELDGNWRAWIAENLACGVDAGEVIEVLVRRGVPRHRASRYVADEEAVRPLQSGSDARLLRALASVYNDNSEEGVDRLEATHPAFEERFFADYYCLNRPVIVAGFAADSPVMRWTIPALIESFGGHSVLVQANRSPDQVDAFRRGRQQRLMLGDYLRSLDSGNGNATYLTGNDRALCEPGLQQLAQDLVFSSGVLEESCTPSHANLWRLFLLQVGVGESAADEEHA